MSKYAVYQLDLQKGIMDEQLKKMALLFDRIYISWSPLHERKLPVTSHAVSDRLAVEEQLFQYLSDHSIVEEIDYSSAEGTIGDYGAEAEQLFIDRLRMIDQLKSMSRTITGTNINAELDMLVKKTAHQMIQVSDIDTRFDTVMLRATKNGDFFPVLRTLEARGDFSKKTSVLKFILNDMPAPDENTPWEQILDFRNDEDVKLKYLALINWVNEVANAVLNENEIEEKYRYLFMQYKKGLERHRMKTGTGVLEIIAALGTGIMSGNLAVYPLLINKFFEVGKYVMNMHVEEENIPGKEIAYIYHAQRSFL